MTRLQADLCLGLTAIIWGAAFIAQKTAMTHIGPFTFTGLRFLLSALCVLPLALRERTRIPLDAAPLPLAKIASFCVAMIGGVLLQQYALLTASITNGGMLTGLYVVLVPVVLTLVFRRRQSMLIWIAAILSIFGTWLLTSDGSAGFQLPQTGDLLLIGSAISFAFQVVLLGMIMEHVRRPLGLCVLQYGVVAVVSIMLALLLESQPLGEFWINLQSALPAVLFAGVVSGGIAYTLQAIAQQYTPSSDAAIIMSAEGLVAAQCGVYLLGEPVTLRIVLGCVAIMAAILLVEAGPILRRLILNRTTN